MATGYIVWDSKNRVIVGGPFPTTAQADSFKARQSRNVDSALTAQTSKDQTSWLTREQVTLN